MFNQVTIIGVGLLGGSLARDLKKHGLAKKVVGVCRSESTRQFALANSVVDEVLPIEEAVKGAQLIVLATPMETMLPLLCEIRQSFPSGAILTDVGSVKVQLYEQFKAKCPELLSQCVFAHPIAGGENSGVSASKLDLFKDKNLIITPTQEVEQSAVEQVKAMWSAIGANVVEMTLQEHDAVFARTSHLPHMVAFSMVNYLDAQENRDVLFDMAAAGFYDFTRIASSDSVMWRDICLTNKAELIAAIDGFQANLENLKNDIERADGTTILKKFERSKLARDYGLKEKGLSKKSS